MGFISDMIKGGGNVIGGLFMRGKRKSKQAREALDRRLKDSTRYDPKESRKAMKDDVQAGTEFARGILQEGGLGRLSEDPNMRQVLDKRRQQMNEGMSDAAQEAFRSKLHKQMAAAEEKAGLRLGAQLGGGSRGAGALAQMRSLQASGLSKRADIETDLFLKDEAAKAQGLDAFEKTATGVSTFDLGQRAKEKGIKMTAGLGFAQMGSAERSAVRSSNAAVTSAQMQQKKPGLLGNLLGGLF